MLHGNCHLSAACSHVLIPAACVMVKESIRGAKSLMGDKMQLRNPAHREFSASLRHPYTALKSKYLGFWCIQIFKTSLSISLKKKRKKVLLRTIFSNLQHFSNHLLFVDFHCQLQSALLVSWVERSWDDFKWEEMQSFSGSWSAKNEIINTGQRMSLENCVCLLPFWRRVKEWPNFVDMVINKLVKKKLHLQFLSGLTNPFLLRLFA